MRWHFWRSPADQPALGPPCVALGVAALAGLAYAWRMDQAYLEAFYGETARSMSQSLHNFVYGAADPWGTVSVDKIPGALWVEALSIRVFGFHVWAMVLGGVDRGCVDGAGALPGRAPGRRSSGRAGGGGGCWRVARS